MKSIVWIVIFVFFSIMNNLVDYFYRNKLLEKNVF